MADLKINLACWAYDRTRALMDGSVKPEGIELTYHNLFPAVTFERLLRNKEFEVSELGLTFYIGTLDLPEPPFIALPIFPLRFFRHSAIFINTNKGIKSPKDLIGKSVGEFFFFGHDAGLWAKGILAEHYGVPTDSVTYQVGGVDHPTAECTWLPFKPPASHKIAHVGNRLLGDMLETGEIDALYSAITPPSMLRGSKNIARLFPEYEAEERGYYKKTGIFPIMHTLVMRRDVYKANPWVAKSIYDAFQKSKMNAWGMYKAGDAVMHGLFMLPWFTHHRDEVRETLGEDTYPYGLEANRKVLDTFCAYHHAHGLSKKRYKPEELFVPELISAA